MRQLRVAILDLNNNEPNQGLKAIHTIVEDFSSEWETQVFDVRAKRETPDTSYDIYIASGGPGNPLDGDGEWDAQFFDLIDELWQHNIHCEKTKSGTKKYVFLVCHSFQMVCHHFNVAEIHPRRSRAFGIFPVHKTASGTKERFFDGLPDPFYAGDFREWQLIQPNGEVLDAIGGEILALEKIRPHVPFERAIMAIRFSPEFFGTQFHPEAEPIKMLQYLRAAKNQQEVIDNHGKEKYDEMVENIHHPQRIALTHDVLIPNFLKNAIKHLTKQMK